MADFYALGELLIDFTPAGKTPAGIPIFEQNPGGAPANVAVQAARLGIQIDAADAVAKGVKPEALRAKVLADLAARSDAAGIIATAPAPGAKESPIVAAAKKSAAASR